MRRLIYLMAVLCAFGILAWTGFIGWKIAEKSQPQMTTDEEFWATHPNPPPPDPVGRR